MTSSPYPAAPINLAHKAALIDEQWSPRVVAEMNDYQFKVVRIEGEFIWHSHPETDEAFLVLEGTLRIDLPDGPVYVAPGNCMWSRVESSTGRLPKVKPG
jgi:mannose-6-phosphate isomerase-like protein (cupin superfamily)